MTTRKQRRIARQAAGLNPHDSCPVQVVPGWQSPHEAGESYYWTWTPNPNGTRVWSNRGRSMYPSYYHGSTRRIVVGAEWLAENADYDPHTITLPADNRQLAIAS